MLIEVWAFGAELARERLWAGNFWRRLGFGRRGANFTKSARWLAGRWWAATQGSLHLMHATDGLSSQNGSKCACIESDHNIRYIDAFPLAKPALLASAPATVLMKMQKQHPVGHKTSLLLLIAQIFPVVS